MLTCAGFSKANSHSPIEGLRLQIIKTSLRWKERSKPNVFLVFNTQLLYLFSLTKEIEIADL